MVTNLVHCMFCGGVLEDMATFVQCANPHCERIDPQMIEIDPGRQNWQPKHCRHRACRKEVSTIEEAFLYDECMGCARGWGIQR